MFDKETFLDRVSLEVFVNFGLPIFNYHNEIFKITKSTKSSETNFLTRFFLSLIYLILVGKKPKFLIYEHILTNIPNLTVITAARSCTRGTLSSRATFRNHKSTFSSICVTEFRFQTVTERPELSTSDEWRFNNAGGSGTVVAVQ